MGFHEPGRVILRTTSFPLRQRPQENMEAKGVDFSDYSNPMP